MPQFRKVRFVCISDTHKQTPKLPPGDILIHAGDLTNQGGFSELRKTVTWLENAEFQAKIVVAGNHDITLNRNFWAEHGARFRYQCAQDPEECRKLLEDSQSITYLNHTSATVRLKAGDSNQYTQIKVFGSPFSPVTGLWAFGYRPDEAALLWGSIPLDSDVVITHTPPKYHCDTTREGPGGCEELRQALWRTRPKLAICGHKHMGRGVERIRWKLDGPSAQVALHLQNDNVVHDAEESIEIWTDPGLGNKKQSLVDLTAKGRRPLDSHDDLPDGMGRRETCVVNAAITGTSHHHPTSLNKPIVVDIDLPVRDDFEDSPDDD